MITVILSFMIFNLLCVVVIALLWRQHHARYAGIGYWLADFILQFFALLLVALDGVVPEFFSLTFADALIIGGAILFYVGLGHFTGSHPPQIYNVLLLLFFIPAHAYAAFVLENHTLHDILFATTLLAVCFQSVWLLMRRVSPEMQLITRSVRDAFASFCVIAIVSIGVELLVPAAENLARNQAIDRLLLFAYQFLLFILAFVLVLIVNRRLQVDLEQDMAARQQTEVALRRSEEKFHKAFQSSPDGVILSRLRDGQYVEVNDSFCRLLGYPREEILANTSLSLGLWARPEDRQELVTELRKYGRVRDREYDFRTRSGATIHSLFSCEVVDLDGEPHILSLMRDITERKRAEKIIHLRLMLWEYAASHPFTELMQRGLDEIEDLTGSLIGFYHIVEADENMLTLQAWSTRTMAEFCEAEGQGMHYPIDEAGVWVDCIRQRRPVIHNDYAALPHRKGLPPGHAEVLREVVVPTIRDGRIVAILGVGNKPTDYDQQDVDLVSYIADLVWAIVEQKRADEQIRQLNTRLEHLAMTDELTSLTNRRFFIAQGIQEFERAQGNHVPFSLFMLDLDGFKTINDRDGHEAGDKALQRIAAVLQENMRKTDILARLGGDEFSVLLPDTHTSDALNLAERLRQAVENAQCQDNGQNLGITASIGVASYQPNCTDLDAVIRQADTAMYQAKSLGGNRVVYLE
jgi:diguanylate cyclase (GGDEF)-like protein/PAS domain S-box-containing protein